MFGSNVWQCRIAIYRSKGYKPLQYLTGRLFKDNVKRDILPIHAKRKQLYKEFINERLRGESTISIWAPLKKARLKGMKNSNSKAQITSTKETLWLV